MTSTNWQACWTDNTWSLPARHVSQQQSEHNQWLPGWFPSPREVSTWRVHMSKISAVMSSAASNVQFSQNTKVKGIFYDTLVNKKPPSYCMAGIFLYAHALYVMSGFQWRKGIWAKGILKKGNWSNSTVAKKTNKCNMRKKILTTIFWPWQGADQHANE